MESNIFEKTDCNINISLNNVEVYIIDKYYEKLGIQVIMLMITYVVR